MPNMSDFCNGKIKKNSMLISFKYMHTALHNSSKCFIIERLFETSPLPVKDYARDSN